MILILQKKGSNAYPWVLDKVLLVIAIENGQYVVYDEEFNYYPYSFDPSSVDVVCDDIPNDWVRVTRDGQETISFAEWANDPHFYSYLAEDTNSKEIMKRRSIVEKHIDEYIRRYAIELYGSIENANIKVSEWFWAKDSEYRRSRGWENDYKHGQIIGLTFDNLYRTSRNE